MNEEWCDVVGYEGLYRISNLGEAWTIRERDARGHRQPIQRLKPFLTDGYPAVSLTKDRRRRIRRVHILVAEAFIGPRPEGMEVRHDDGDSLNPVLSNLAYGTHAENQADQVRHGTHAQASRSTCRRREHRLMPPNLVISTLLRQGNPGRACRSCAWGRANAHYLNSTGRVGNRDACADAHYQELMSGDHHLALWLAQLEEALPPSEGQLGRGLERDAAWCRVLRDALGINDRAALALLRRELGAVEVAS